MASFGTPNEGKDNIIGTAIYTTSLQCGLYNNASDSLGVDSTLSSIDEQTGTGYARVNLDGTWSFNNGVVTHSPVAQFTNTSAGSWGTDYTGAFITDGTYLLHFLDRPGGARTVAAGETVEVDISTLAV